MKLSTIWLKSAAIALLVAAAPPARADVAADLAAASKAGRAVFLIVTEGEARGTDLARRVCSDAAKYTDSVSVVELDRAAAANAETVKRYRLGSIEVPLILVISPNGVAAAATKPSAVTASRLARMIPSPAKASHLKALEDGEPTFLVFSAEKTPGRAETLAACAAAQKALEGKAITLSVDLDDEREAGFREEMKVPAKLSAPLTIVVNAKAQRTETFEAVPEVKALVEASQKVVAECCPGGHCK